MADTPDHPVRFSSDRRERARQMVEAGLIGGAGRGQGRKPKGQTAGEQVAELAQREAGAIKRAYSDGLRSPNERTRILAAKELLAEERRERDREAYEEMLRKLPDAELDTLLLAQFEEMAGALGIDLPSAMTAAVIDAEVVEDDPIPELDTHV